MTLYVVKLRYCLSLSRNYSDVLIKCCKCLVCNNLWHWMYIVLRFVFDGCKTFIHVTRCYRTTMCVKNAKTYQVYWVVRGHPELKTFSHCYILRVVKKLILLVTFCMLHCYNIRRGNIYIIFLKEKKNRQD